MLAALNRQTLFIRLPVKTCLNFKKDWFMPVHYCWIPWKTILHIFTFLINFTIFWIRILLQPWMYMIFFFFFFSIIKIYILHIFSVFEIALSQREYQIFSIVGWLVFFLYIDIDTLYTYISSPLPPHTHVCMHASAHACTDEQTHPPSHIHSYTHTHSHLLLNDIGNWSLISMLIIDICVLVY